ncbi:TPA: holin, partial [Streptococcus pyogenes]|nr:holin [Streptococcus pyogenes]
VGMAGRLKAIEQENGSLAKYDQQTDIDVGLSDKIDVVIDSLEISINGVTYTATKKPI